MKPFTALPIVLWFVLLSVSPTPVPASESSLSEDASALLQRLAQRQRSLQTLSADLLQRKTTPLLVEPSIARGKLYWQEPGRLRIEFNTPHRAILLLSPDEGVFYDVDLEKAKVIANPGDHPLWKTLQGFTFDVEWEASPLNRDFSVSLQRHPQTYEMVLTPRSARMRRGLASIQISIDAQTELPSRIHIQGRRGRETTLELENIQVNPKLPSGFFEIQLPDTVEVTELP